jgi:hypothetical protein
MDDWTQFLRGMYEHILNLQKAVREQQVFVIGMRDVLKQNPSLEALYSQAFADAQKHPAVVGLDATIAVTSQLIQQMGSDERKRGLDEA